MAVIADAIYIVIKLGQFNARVRTPRSNRNSTMKESMNAENT